MLIVPSEISPCLDNAPYLDGYSICLRPGRYVFSIYDSGGNGICCQHGEGGYAIAVNGKGLKNTDGQYGEAESTQFIVDKSCCNPRGSKCCGVGQEKRTSQ